MSMTEAQIDLARQYLADQGTSAVQSILIDGAISGTFTISFDGQTTADIAFDAGANTVQNALCALSNIDVGGITVVLGSGIVGAIVYDIYFAGDLQYTAQPMFTVDTTDLNGVSVEAVISLATAGGVTTFTDEELNSQYDFAQANFFLAICYMFRVLMSNAAKFNDYVAGQSQEKKSQIFDHLEIMANKYEEWSRAGDQLQMASLVPVPPRLRAIPNPVGVPSTSLVYGPPYGRWGRQGGW